MGSQLRLVNHVTCPNPNWLVHLCAWAGHGRLIWQKLWTLMLNWFFVLCLFRQRLKKLFDLVCERAWSEFYCHWSSFFFSCYLFSCVFVVSVTNYKILKGKLIHWQCESSQFPARQVYSCLKNLLICTNVGVKKASLVKSLKLPNRPRAFSCISKHMKWRLLWLMPLFMV